jgi:hypothetical protein
MILRLFFGLVFLPSLAHGQLAVAPGLGILEGHRTLERNERGHALGKFQAGLGLVVEGEYFFFRQYVSIPTGFLWTGQQAQMQYSFSSISNPLDTASVEDLDTNASSFIGHLGLRLRPYNRQYFKLFLGAGATLGKLFLSYDENKFEFKTGGRIGLKSNEQQKIQGHYLEAGIELFTKKGGGLRVFARELDHQSEPFETLSHRRLTLKATQFSILYLHLID